MLIRSNRCDGARFQWDRLGFLLVTRRWVVATRFHALAYR